MTITILNGGMSRELMRLNAPFRQPEWTALSLYEAPEAIQQVHENFIANGAEFIDTNSYAVVPFHIGEERFKQDGQRLAALSGQLARAAVEKSGKKVIVGASLPPLFGSYRPDLFQPERVKEVAQPLIDGLSPYVDVWLSETQSSIIEPVSLKPLLPNDGRPFWVAFTLQDEDHSLAPCLRSGESVESAVEAMIELGVSAILYNCSQPEVIEQALVVTRETLAKHNISNIQIGAYANAFGPQKKDASANEEVDELRKDLTPEAYLEYAKKWQQLGAELIGGCCGIGLEHIKALYDYFKAN